DILTRTHIYTRLTDKAPLNFELRRINEEGVLVCCNYVREIIPVGTAAELKQEATEKGGYEGQGEAAV
ncbi:hypothetical protein HDU88_005488, partial [Geranomyces variabilis]